MFGLFWLFLVVLRFHQHKIGALQKLKLVLMTHTVCPVNKSGANSWPAGNLQSWFGFFFHKANWSYNFFYAISTILIHRNPQNSFLDYFWQMSVLPGFMGDPTLPNFFLLTIWTILIDQDPQNCCLSHSGAFWATFGRFCALGNQFWRHPTSAVGSNRSGWMPPYCFNCFPGNLNC